MTPWASCPCLCMVLAGWLELTHQFPPALRTQKQSFLALKIPESRRMLYWSKKIAGRKSVCSGLWLRPRATLQHGSQIQSSFFLVLCVTSACTCLPDGIHSVLLPSQTGSEISTFSKIQNLKTIKGNFLQSPLLLPFASSPKSFPGPCTLILLHACSGLGLGH